MLSRIILLVAILHLASTYTISPIRTEARLLQVSSICSREPNLLPSKCPVVTCPSHLVLFQNRCLCPDGQIPVSGRYCVVRPKNNNVGGIGGRGGGSAKINIGQKPLRYHLL